jgi:hypothetical protein
MLLNYAHILLSVVSHLITFPVRQLENTRLGWVSSPATTPHDRRGDTNLRYSCQDI